MKKKQVHLSKLTLNKSMISNLHQMQQLKGGSVFEHATYEGSGCPACYEPSLGCSGAVEATCETCFSLPVNMTCLPHCGQPGG
ncbi:hypothetical protein [Taibaiella koreensis]|uniref:hypothetical protein n=1 Tax=Taibaiella koreensis TaxID=1268548 RepID=UPI0013C368EB|nr:hypothetical protein [Taibaiella koreensis]